METPFLRGSNKEYRFEATLRIVQIITNTFLFSHTRNIN